MAIPREMLEIGTSLADPSKGFSPTRPIRSMVWKTQEIKAQKGAPVRSMAAGVIHGTGKHVTAGRWVDIDHGNGRMTRYLHLHRIKVKRGETVRAGQLVGKVGDTGNAKASGPHLHFELVEGGVKKDPLPVLKRMLR